MNESSTKILANMLRGEMSAVETYEQVLEKIKGDPEEPAIKQLYSDHQFAVERLKSKMLERRNEPTGESGAWGGVAKTVAGTAKLFGDRTAVSALKKGEEYGLRQYTEALEKNIDADLRSMIQRRFIPNQRQHISRLETILNRMAS